MHPPMSQWRQELREILFSAEGNAFLEASQERLKVFEKYVADVINAAFEALRVHLPADVYTAEITRLNEKIGKVPEFSRDDRPISQILSDELVVVMRQRLAVLFNDFDHLNPGEVNFRAELAASWVRAAVASNPEFTHNIAKVVPIYDDAAAELILAEIESEHRPIVQDGVTYIPIGTCVAAMNEVAGQLATIARDVSAKRKEALLAQEHLCNDLRRNLDKGCGLLTDLVRLMDANGLEHVIGGQFFSEINRFLGVRRTHDARSSVR